MNNQTNNERNSREIIFDKYNTDANFINTRKFTIYYFINVNFILAMRKNFKEKKFYV